MEINDHLNDVFEYAKKMEMDGKKMYEEELAKTENEGIKNILRMLVDAEDNHFEIFDNMQKKQKTPVKHMSLKEVKNIFQEMKDSGEEVVCSHDHLEFYQKLKNVEEETEKFYRDEADKAEDADVKEVLNEIADEEHRHVILMDNLAEFAKKPQQWVEHAEFNHMEEY